jgi:predicted metal-dependent hydrolase
VKVAPPARWETLEEAITKDVFKAEVSAWAKRIGVEPKEIHIRPMKKKWGSCSTSGRLSFASDLLHLHSDFRKRVIIEEL